LRDTREEVVPLPESGCTPAADAATRRQRLLRLQRAATTLQGQLNAVRHETQRLVALEERRPLTPSERTRATHLKLQAEGLYLELRGLRASVTETLHTGRSGSL